MKRKQFKNLKFSPIYQSIRGVKDSPIRSGAGIGSELEPILNYSNNNSEEANLLMFQLQALQSHLSTTI